MNQFKASSISQFKEGNVYDPHEASHAKSFVQSFNIVGSTGFIGGFYDLGCFTSTKEQVGKVLEEKQKRKVLSKKTKKDSLFMGDKIRVDQVIHFMEKNIGQEI